MRTLHSLRKSPISRVSKVQGNQIFLSFYSSKIFRVDDQSPKIPDHFVIKLVILFWTELTSNNQIKSFFLFRKTVDILCQTYLPWLKKIWNSLCNLLVSLPRQNKIYVFILSEQFAWPTQQGQCIKMFLMFINLAWTANIRRKTRKVLIISFYKCQCFISYLQYVWISFD